MLILVPSSSVAWGCSAVLGGADEDRVQSFNQLLLFEVANKWLKSRPRRKGGRESISGQCSFPQPPVDSLITTAGSPLPQGRGCLPFVYFCF
jgi:hypothetical protein